jgi:osmotically-inducible protein OsmY
MGATPAQPDNLTSQMPLTPTMRRTPALIAAAVVLSVYGSSALPQAAAATGQPQQAAPSTSDEGLTQAVSSALDADPNYYYRHVNVRVDKGVAKLSGYVDSSAAIYRARSIASKVSGVTRVETNHLKIDTQLRR